MARNSISRLIGPPDAARRCSFPDGGSGRRGRLSWRGRKPGFRGRRRHRSWIGRAPGSRRRAAESGPLEYVEGHVHLRQTLARARRGGGWLALTKAADRAELCLQRGFKYSKDEILDFIVHGGLRSIRAQKKDDTLTSVCQYKSA